jgi:hypothetical protein
MTSFDQTKYEKIKGQAHNFFQNNQKIQSAALGTVRLTSDGFLHLIWKGAVGHKKRDWKNQLKRFDLLRYLKPILTGMSHYQEYQEIIQTIKIKRQSTTLLEQRKVSYWGFVAVIENKIRIKVILKQIDGGHIVFWSIIPFWNTKEYKDITTINLTKGNLESD